MATPDNLPAPPNPDPGAPPWTTNPPKPAMEPVEEPVTEDSPEDEETA